MNAILYSSSDASAPVFTRSVGSLITVLKACLVNGYGSKAALGYTIPFEDAGNKVCVFRQPSGTQMYIQIQDNAAGNDYSRAQIQAFKAMSSAYVGIEQCPSIGALPIVYLYKEVTATTTNATPLLWYLIGDDKGFWFISFIRTLGGASVSYYATTQVYIGDYIPFDITNVYNFCIIAPNASPNCFWYTQGAGAASGAYPHYVLRDCNFSFGSVLAGLYCPHVSGGYFGVIGFTIPMSLFNGRYISVPLYIQTVNGILGSMPGIQQPFFRYSTSYTILQNDSLPVVYTDGNNQQLVINPGYSGNMSASQYSGKCVINAGSKFRYVY